MSQQDRRAEPILSGTPSLRVGGESREFLHRVHRLAVSRHRPLILPLPHRRRELHQIPEVSSEASRYEIIFHTMLMSLPKSLTEMFGHGYTFLLVLQMQERQMKSRRVRWRMVDGEGSEQ